MTKYDLLEDTIDYSLYHEFAAAMYNYYGGDIEGWEFTCNNAINNIEALVNEGHLRPEGADMIKEALINGGLEQEVNAKLPFSFAKDETVQIAEIYKSICDKADGLITDLENAAEKCDSKDNRDVLMNMANKLSEFKENVSTENKEELLKLFDKIKNLEPNIQEMIKRTEPVKTIEKPAADKPNKHKSNDDFTK